MCIGLSLWPRIKKFYRMARCWLLFPFFLQWTFLNREYINFSHVFVLHFVIYLRFVVVHLFETHMSEMKWNGMKKKKLFAESWDMLTIWISLSPFAIINITLCWIIFLFCYSISIGVVDVYVCISKKSFIKNPLCWLDLRDLLVIFYTALKILIV